MCRLKLLHLCLIVYFLVRFTAGNWTKGGGPETSLPPPTPPPPLPPPPTKPSSPSPPPNVPSSTTTAFMPPTFHEPATTAVITVLTVGIFIIASILCIVLCCGCKKKEKKKMVLPEIQAEEGRATEQKPEMQLCRSRAAAVTPLRIYKSKYRPNEEDEESKKIVCQLIIPLPKVIIDSNESFVLSFATRVFTIGDAWNLFSDKIQANEIVTLCRLARDHLKKLPSLLELDHPINIVGDLHGHYNGLIGLLFNNAGFPPDRAYLFLGDYVDRGIQAPETITLLFCLMLLFPSKVRLLRGNHEDTRNISMDMEDLPFEGVLRHRVKNADYKAINEAFKEAFSWLPYAALVGGKVLCMHGGISPELQSLDNLRGIPRGPSAPRRNSGLAKDTVWSDPMDREDGGDPAKNAIKEEKEEDLHSRTATSDDFENGNRSVSSMKSIAPKFIPNEARGTSVQFSEEAVQEVLKNLGLDLIVRAHQPHQKGHKFFAGRKCLTIFSAAYYEGIDKNDAGLLVIDRNFDLTIYEFGWTCPKERPTFAYFKSGFDEALDKANIPEFHSKMVQFSVETRGIWDVDLAPNMTVIKVPITSPFVNDLLLGDQICMMNDYLVSTPIDILDAMNCSVTKVVVNRAWNLEPVPVSELPGKKRAKNWFYMKVSIPISPRNGLGISCGKTDRVGRLIVTKVRNMSPASFGLMVGDRIVKVGGRRVKDVKSINRIIASEAKNFVVEIVLGRKRDHPIAIRPSVVATLRHGKHRLIGDGLAAQVGAREAARLCYRCSFQGKNGPISKYKLKDAQQSKLTWSQEVIVKKIAAQTRLLKPNAEAEDEDRDELTKCMDEPEAGVEEDCKTKLPDDESD